MDRREDIASTYLFLPEGGGEEVTSSHQGQPSRGFPEGEGGPAPMFCELLNFLGGRVAAYLFLLLGVGKGGSGLVLR